MLAHTASVLTVLALRRPQLSKLQQNLPERMKECKQHRRKEGQRKGVMSINFLHFFRDFHLHFQTVSCYTPFSELDKLPFFRFLHLGSQLPLGSPSASWWFFHDLCRWSTLLPFSVYVFSIFLYAVITYHSVPLPVLCYHLQSTTSHLQTHALFCLQACFHWYLESNEYI